MTGILLLAVLLTAVEVDDGLPPRGPDLSVEVDCANGRVELLIAVTNPNAERLQILGVNRLADQRLLRVALRHEREGKAVVITERLPFFSSLSPSAAISLQPSETSRTRRAIDFDPAALASLKGRRAVLTWDGSMRLRDFSQAMPIAGFADIKFSNEAGVLSCRAGTAIEFFKPLAKQP